MSFSFILRAIHMLSESCTAYMPLLSCHVMSCHVPHLNSRSSGLTAAIEDARTTLCSDCTNFTHRKDGRLGVSSNTIRHHNHHFAYDLYHVPFISPPLAIFRYRSPKGRTLAPTLLSSGLIELPVLAIWHVLVADWLVSCVGCVGYPV
jgi:hypothetical protein